MSKRSVYNAKVRDGVERKPGSDRDKILDARKANDLGKQEISEHPDQDLMATILTRCKQYGLFFLGDIEAEACRVHLTNIEILRMPMRTRLTCLNGTSISVMEPSRRYWRQ
ncbi:unnamed protein product [Lepeophtheirus salmonis]|uniref:(salmon louse) hypothetical protein n=1 Tax=Lepeophtheirus salmonis TaxID=72036 RepID=A0A7R8D691_LEPSM|nr:unnamed protein product [Lepeophtheirus salmonis]CAF3013849.1 unnamed protein product [Lepeophtheirus salmonis]